MNHLVYGYQSIWIGYEPRELDSYVVARHSTEGHNDSCPPIHGIILKDAQDKGWYRRKYYVTAGRMVDKISDAPMSTEFSISRFLTPALARERYPDGHWALYMDCDMLVRADILDLFALADRKKAVMCVQHVHEPVEKTKMDNQFQLHYARKNWSSVMLFNLKHPANNALTVDLINTVPGRDLHRFCWLEDNLIGELPPEWNYLVGHSTIENPKIVHFTSGTPSMYGYERTEYADEWRECLRSWLR